jgi:hypothetical protein
MVSPNKRWALANASAGSQFHQWAKRLFESGFNIDLETTTTGTGVF